MRVSSSGRCNWRRNEGAGGESEAGRGFVSRDICILLFSIRLDAGPFAGVQEGRVSCHREHIVRRLAAWPVDLGSPVRACESKSGHCGAGRRRRIRSRVSVFADDAGDPMSFVSQSLWEVSSVPLGRDDFRLSR